MATNLRPPFVVTSSRHVSVVVAAPLGDVHGDAVVDALRARGVSVARLTADLVRTASVRWQPSSPVVFRDEGCRWHVDDRTTVWWRRPGVAQPVELDGIEQRLVAEEVAVILPGVLDAVGVRWVDAPWALHRARMKPIQLATAGKLGINIPSTLVTGDPLEAAAFASGAEPLAKAVSSGRGIAPHVASVPPEQLGLVEACPTTLQERVDACADLRVVTIGDQVFGWKRVRLDGGAVDWRADDPSGVGFEPRDEAAIPEALALAAALGLSFSVQDWLETAHGPVFLEVNPQGQWLFLREADRILCPTVADHLRGLHG